MPARTRETCDTGRFKNRGQRKKHSEGIWKEPENGVEKKEPENGVEKKEPRKPNDSNGFRGSNPGGEYEIRTREAVTPTRFPSVRHRPLGEFSNYSTLPGVYP